jgi:hypothetical protein
MYLNDGGGWEFISASLHETTFFQHAVFIPTSRVNDMTDYLIYVYKNIVYLRVTTIYIQ